jgi:hypothetical protein
MAFGKEGRGLVLSPVGEPLPGTESMAGAGGDRFGAGGEEAAPCRGRGA